MPEPSRHHNSHPAKPPYRLADAARQGMLVVVKCNLCRRCVHYLAADLVEVLPGDRPALAPLGRCSACRTAEYMRVTLRQPHAGDVGQLVVRRPGKARVVREWHDVPL